LPSEEEAFGCVSTGVGAGLQFIISAQSRIMEAAICGGSGAVKGLLVAEPGVEDGLEAIGAAKERSSGRIGSSIG
jgi:hypothetical protein